MLHEFFSYNPLSCLDLSDEDTERVFNQRKNTEVLHFIPMYTNITAHASILVAESETWRGDGRCFQWLRILLF